MMKRRDVLNGIAVLLSAPIMGRLLSGRMFYGPLTVDRHRRLQENGLDLHVFYRGEDVTNRCTFADDTPGHERAELLKHNSHGKPFYDSDNDCVARETVTGIGIEVRKT